MKAFLDRRLPDIVLGVVILLVATLLWFSGGSPSRAQTPQCGALAEVLAGLASRYNEVVVADGEAGGGADASDHRHAGWGHLVGGHGAGRHGLPGVGGHQLARPDRTCRGGHLT
jgi:hypothetical protein